MFKLLLCLAAGTLAAPAATIYDLESDFSNTSNPNGVWSFDLKNDGISILPFQSQPTDGNALNLAAANGYFGVANTFSSAPFIFEATQNGASTSPYTNNDFEAGDILAHSPNPGSFLLIEWTAPEAGTITFSGDVWYAHSPVDRSQDYAVVLGEGAPLASGTVAWNSGNGRSNPSTFSSSGPLAVAAGDTLALELSPTTGQTFGSLSGVNFTVDLTASTQAPEPNTYLLLAVGLLGMVAMVGRRRATQARQSS